MDDYAFPRSRVAGEETSGKESALRYESAGVSIDRGNAWVGVIRSLVERGGKDPRVAGGIGGFSGLFRIGGGKLLAACCDGVGTKLEIAREVGNLRGLGQDLVAMNVNDLVTCGAVPLFFLDYIACGFLDSERYAEVVEDIVNACAASDCVLLGGETAEMPGVYPREGFDLAGFAVGMVEEERLVDGSGVASGDLLVALPSSGLHSNGFSLVRRAVEKAGLSLAATPPGLDEPLGQALLRPTRLYVREALAAARTGVVKAMAHITGGGLEENVNRVLGKYRAAVDYGSWKRPAVFSLLASLGIAEEEMRRVFNLGAGFVFVVSPDDEADLRKTLASFRTSAGDPFVLGEVVQQGAA